jgi:caffeoyl-CoA O-methyltransferase
VFHNIPRAIQERMYYLECIDKRDREDGTPHIRRLRQVPPETGKFIALLASSAPDGTYLEIGTSAGYSALWLSLACRELGRKLVTFEVNPEKAELARETFRMTAVEAVVELIKGDARAFLEVYKNVSFCFLDTEREIYRECYEKVVPQMIKGGLLIADNAISHREAMQPMLDRALADVRVDALVVPIGTGDLVCRKL